MKHSEVLSRYVNTGQRIPEKQYDRLTPSLKKSYLRMRGVAGYEGWEFKIISDDERIKFIEKKGKELDYDEVKYLLQYTENKNTIATKIIEKIGYHHLDSFVMKLLLSFSKNKELIKKLLLQKGIDYEVINYVITDLLDEDIPLIPDNYQSMLNEIRRIKEIMI
jgi:hypothetical protein